MRFRATGTAARLLFAAGILTGCGEVNVDRSADGGGPDAAEDAAPESGPGACFTSSDCVGYEQCVQGRCCNGQHDGGACFCGDGPGCKPWQECCHIIGTPPSPVCGPIQCAYYDMCVSPDTTCY